MPPRGNGTKQGPRKEPTGGRAHALLLATLLCVIYKLHAESRKYIEILGRDQARTPEGPVMVMVMVIRLGLNRSLPRYLYGNSGPVQRERRRASNTGKEEPFLARPHFVALSRLRYGIIPPPLALGVGCWGPAP